MYGYITWVSSVLGWFLFIPKEEVAKNLLAEFNLGCDAHRTEHVYRVYVSTFLGFGGNAARQSYELSLIRNTATQNKWDPQIGLLYLISFFYPSFYIHAVTDFSRLLGQHVGETAASPVLDPCLPTDLQDEIGPSTQRLYLRGTGDFEQCRQILQPFLNHTNETHTSLSGVYQPPIDYNNSQFYGFSEFYYCTEDVLRMGGDYNASKYAQAAKVNATQKNKMYFHEACQDSVYNYNLYYTSFCFLFWVTSFSYVWCMTIMLSKLGK